jgi:hypothetical protein
MFDSQGGIFFSPPRPDWLYGSPNLLSNKSLRLFPQEQSDLSVKMTTRSLYGTGDENLRFK